MPTPIPYTQSVKLDKEYELIYYLCIVKKVPAQFIATSLTALTFLTLTTISYAQTANDTTTTPIPTTTSMTATPTPANKSNKNTLPPTAKEKVTLEMQGKKQAFLEKVALIKDAKKKATVERIDTMIMDVNKKRTSQMSEALLRMNKVLTELTSKSALAKEQGQDTAKLNTAIAAAQAAIKTAETAVTTQAAKEYTPTITTESALRTTVGATVRVLQTDLRNTHAAVSNAKQKVILAVKELASLNGNTTDKEATESAEEM
jgi:hypothetical protein